MPALPGCRTWGATVEGVLAMERDAIAVYLSDEPDAPPAGEAIVTTVAIDVPIGAAALPIRSN